MPANNGQPYDTDPQAVLAGQPLVTENGIEIVPQPTLELIEDLEEQKAATAIKNLIENKNKGEINTMANEVANNNNNQNQSSFLSGTTGTVLKYGAAVGAGALAYKMIMENTGSSNAEEAVGLVSDICDLF